ncbi:MAG: lamin tail domain-containing protein [Caldilineaceae bacterium]
MDYDQPSTDTAEFLEIKNNETVAVNLNAYSIVLVNGNGNATYATFDLPNVDLAAGDYFVICADASTTPACDLDVSPDSNLIQNGAPDAVAIMLGDTIVDAVSYEAGDMGVYTEGGGALPIRRRRLCWHFPPARWRRYQ